jgi:hypothetical protein
MLEGLRRKFEIVIVVSRITSGFRTLRAGPAEAA